MYHLLEVECVLTVLLIRRNNLLSLGDESSYWFPDQKGQPCRSSQQDMHDKESPRIFQV